MGLISDEVRERVSSAVAQFWQTREGQRTKQRARGRKDQGARGAVTGGAQMDGFTSLLADLIVRSGIGQIHVFRKKRLELPGFFRPTKEWDLLVVKNHELVLAVELKSQVGPSFGNNFNNRTEEAMGSALDLWTAYREGGLTPSRQPWLGYMFLLEDCPKSRLPVSVREPHFEVFPEFVGASYAKRYELFCRKLVRERHYNAAAFLTTARESGRNGSYEEPAKDLTFEGLARALMAHVSAFAD